MAPVAALAMGFGTAFSSYNQYQAGKEAQEIANQRAAVDMANAEAEMRSAREKARLKTEQGRKLIKRQKAEFAARGIRLDIGTPLVIEAQTRADLLKDVGFIMETGRTRAEQYRQSAAIERRYGRHQRRQSMWSAVGTGLSGFGSLGLQIHEGGGLNALFD